MRSTIQCIETKKLYKVGKIKIYLSKKDFKIFILVSIIFSLLGLMYFMAQITDAAVAQANIGRDAATHLQAQLEACTGIGNFSVTPWPADMLQELQHTPGASP